jgi:hypothetical protein
MLWYVDESSTENNLLIALGGTPYNIKYQSDKIALSNPTEGDDTNVLLHFQGPRQPAPTEQIRTTAGQRSVQMNGQLRSWREVAARGNANIQ